MRTTLQLTLLITGLFSTSLAFGQRYDDRDDRRYGSSRRNDDERRYTERDLRSVYDEGFKDGKKETEGQKKEEAEKGKKKGYQNFAFGVYGGVNSTRFEGEDVDGNELTGRLGYQLGFFLRGGGRIYGQIGAEYFTSSSDFYKAGDGASVDDITASINQQYVHLPAYIGVKLVQSERGVSAVRLQFGAEYAIPVGVNTNEFNLEQGDFRNGTVNGLVGLGFDAGPVMLGFVYHHGFADVLNDSNTSKRRILGVNIGFKF